MGHHFIIRRAQPASIEYLLALLCLYFQIYLGFPLDYGDI